MINYELFAWGSSPYSAKVRAYFKYRKIAYKEITPSIVTFRKRLIPKVGKMIMPVVIRNDGHVMQDSTDIICQIEASMGVGRVSIFPNNPVLQLVNLLLELNADEWMVMSAMRYRWQRPGNRDYIVQDFGDCIAPWLPKPLRKFAGRKVADRMQAHLRRLGIEGDMGAAIDAWTESYLAAMNKILADQPYILGSHPTLADFAIFGPVSAHLYRDPASREVLEPHQHVVAWIERLQGDVPVTKPSPIFNLHPALLPLLEHQFADQVPALIDTAHWLSCIKVRQKNRVIPAQVAVHEFSVGGVKGQRLARTFSLWRLQALQDYYSSLSTTNQQVVSAWFAEQQLSEDILHCQFPRIKRKDFKEVYA